MSFLQLVKDKGMFYKVCADEIHQSEEDMQVRLPGELVKFYNEIGYGFFATKNGNINRLMDPLSIRDFRLRQNDFEYFPDIQIYDDFEERKLVFFEVNESIFFSIEVNTDNIQRIFLYDVEISKSLSEFVKAFTDDENFYEKFL